MNPPPRAGTLLPLGFWHDPAYAALGSSGLHLLISATSYSADHLTDGVVPASIVKMLAAMTDQPEAAVRRVIEAGLVTVQSDGRWLLAPKAALMNLTAAEVEERREQKRLAGKVRAQNAKRDPVTHRFLPSTPADEPASGPAGAGSGAGAESQQGASTGASEKASPTPVTRIPYSVGTKDDYETNGVSRNGGADLWQGWDEKWDSVREALEERGLKLPPTVRQRDTLWPIVDARPTGTAMWIRSAPADAKMSDIVGIVLLRWKELEQQAEAQTAAPA